MVHFWSAPPIELSLPRTRGAPVDIHMTISAWPENITIWNINEFLDLPTDEFSLPYTRGVPVDIHMAGTWCVSGGRSTLGNQKISQYKVLMKSKMFQQMSSLYLIPGVHQSISTWQVNGQFQVERALRVTREYQEMTYSWSSTGSNRWVLPSP